MTYDRSTLMLLSCSLCSWQLPSHKTNYRCPIDLDPRTKILSPPSIITTVPTRHNLFGIFVVRNIQYLTKITNRKMPCLPKSLQTKGSCHPSKVVISSTSRGAFGPTRGRICPTTGPRRRMHSWQGCTPVLDFSAHRGNKRQNSEQAPTV